MHRVIIGLTLLLAATASGQDAKPNFTGRWKLNVRESVNPPRSEVDAIEHKDPKIIITPQVGRADVVFGAEYRTDGEPLKDKEVVSGKMRSAHWEGSNLVIETKTPGYGGVSGLKREVMYLSDDGKTLHRDVYDGLGDRPGEKLVFEKVCKYSGHLPRDSGEAEVRSVLGEPQRVEKQEDGTHMVYDQAEVILVDGRVRFACFCVPCK